MSKEIPLTQNQVAIVDDDVFESINQYHWYATFKSKTWYAARSLPRRDGKKNVYLHRIIMQAGSEETVDHIDGNGLNCQRVNLRICTHEQNLHNAGPNRDNTSGYKGVVWLKNAHKWLAQIRGAGGHHYLGRYATAEEAAEAYNRAALKYHGEFARLNKIH